MIWFFLAAFLLMSVLSLVVAVYALLQYFKLVKEIRDV